MEEFSFYAHCETRLTLGAMPDVYQRFNEIYFVQGDEECFMEAFFCSM